ncbi:MAG: SEC-C domain-containing protein [Anaerotignum sp.]|nr:SEC-C domain-containing protein [Anaerotignum sp.]
MNEQREIIYGERKRVLYGENLRESIIAMIGSVVDRTVDTHMDEEQLPEEWDMNAFSETLSAVIPVGKVNIKDDALQQMTKEKLAESLKKLAVQLYEMKEKEIGQGNDNVPADPERMRELERMVMLRVIDQKWMDHIDDMDRMRQGIGLHAYAQRDPLTEYKFASYDMFDEMSEHIQEDTLRMLYRIRIQTPVKQEEPKQMFTNKDDTLVKQPKTRSEEKVGRNDPCPCGSGKKYKQCCGRNA